MSRFISVGEITVDEWVESGHVLLCDRRRNPDHEPVEQIVAVPVGDLRALAACLISMADAHDNPAPDPDPPNSPKK